MALAVFKQFPWIGGRNSSLDESTVPPNQLVLANHVQFGVRGSKKKRDAINFDWDSATAGSLGVVGLLDFFYGTTSKTHRLISVTDDKDIHSYQTDGTRSADLFGGSTWSSSVTRTSMLTFNNRALIAVNGSGNVVKQLDATSGSLPSTAKDLGRSEIFTVTCGADTAGDYGGKYFTCSSPSTNYYVWFDVDNTDVDPAPVGKTGIEVNIAAGATGNTIALAIETAMEAVGSGLVFSVSVNSTVATVTVLNPGAVTDAADVDVDAATATTFTVAVSTQGISAPIASVLGSHLGRVFTNDKTNVDRLQYCSTGNCEEWGGVGDSGAIDIRPGDGDPVGITAIFSFKGSLFVAKSTKLYRISGYTPETFQVDDVSSSIGIAGPNCWAAIDQDDVFFVSKKGVHSLATTDSYGDFESQYVSFDIQDDFNQNFTASRLEYAWLAYLPSENSIALALTDSRIDTGINKSIEMYNLPLKSWYRIPEVQCQSLITVSDTDRQRLYIGGDNSRVYKANIDSNSDTNDAGSETGIAYQLSTGQLFVDGDPTTEKAFKRVGIFFAPRGDSTVTITAKIDNKPIQSVVLNESSGDDLLGSTFILGESDLGSDSVLAPYSRQIDGIGRGIKLTFAQSGSAEEIEIQGFFVEYEPMNTTSPEVAGTPAES